MKKRFPLLLLVGICSLPILTACSGGFGSLQSISPASPIAQFMTQNGYASVGKNEIVSVQFDMYASGSNQELKKEVDGQTVETLLLPLGLGIPFQPGGTSAQVQGEVQIQWKDARGVAQSRKLWILDCHWLQDESYPDIYYRPAVRVNHGWVRSITNQVG